MDPITNPNFVPTFNASPFPGVAATPGDMGGLVQSVIGMGNQSQALINALATGQIPENLFAGVEGMGIQIPKPPRMDLFMAYTNLQAAQQQEETALGDRIKGNANDLVDAFYKSHHLEFDGNGNPRVADPPATVTANQVDLAGPAQEADAAAAALNQASSQSDAADAAAARAAADLAAANQRVTAATNASRSAQTTQTGARTSLADATTAAADARTSADALAAAAATDPDGIVPNSNPPITNAQAAAQAAADVVAADQAVADAQADLAAADAATAAAAAELAAAQAAAAQAAAASTSAASAAASAAANAVSAENRVSAANAAVTAAQQQAQIEANTAEIQNLNNQISAQETFEQRQQRLEWQGRQEEATRASFEPQRQALQARQQQMLAQVQATGRQDPQLMEQLQQEEADLNTRIEKAVILSKLPPGAAQAPADSPLGQLYASVQNDFSQFDQLRASNRAELENSEAGREIRRFLAESRAFTASLPTREQAFDPNAMRAFAQRMGLSIDAPQLGVNLGAPTVPTDVDYLADLGIQPPPV